MLVQELQDVVDDCVLGFREEARFRKSLLRNLGTGILAADLGDDAVEVFFRTESLPVEHLHNRDDLLHIGDRGFFEGHGFACGAVGTHLTFSMEPCSRCQR